MSPITVAIIGATGGVGFPTAQIFLSKDYYPEKVSRVVFFTRDLSSPKAKELIALGAEGVQVEGNVLTSDSLKGVDVLVSATGALIDNETRIGHAKAAVEAGVKVYFPPEYGADPRLSKVQHPWFKQRMEASEYPRNISGSTTKVISLSNGSFMNYLTSDFLGVDTKTNVYTAWGDPNVKISATHIPDVARAIARLAILAINDPKSVPDHVRISGDAVSFNALAELMSKESGEPVKVIGNDWEAIRKDLDEKKAPAFHYVRLMYSEGAVDFSKNNHNELVNPGQSLWKWYTVADHARDTKGKPEPWRS